MNQLPGLLRSQDELTARIAAVDNNHARTRLLNEGEILISRCISTGEALRQWETTAIAACHDRDRERLPNIVGSSTLLELCTTYNYGFFHAVMR
jgi:hypothetical protein